MTRSWQFKRIRLNKLASCQKHKRDTHNFTHSQVVVTASMTSRTFSTKSKCYIASSPINIHVFKLNYSRLIIPLTSFYWVWLGCIRWFSYRGFNIDGSRWSNTILIQTSSPSIYKWCIPFRKVMITFILTRKKTLFVCVSWLPKLAYFVLETKLDIFVIIFVILSIEVPCIQQHVISIIWEQLVCADVVERFQMLCEKYCN